MKRTFFIITSLLLLIVMALPVAANAFPEVIQLPTAFEAEGITIGANHTAYAGSLADGTIVAADLRSGAVNELVAGAPGRITVGLDYDARSNYLFAAGGLNAVGRVYDAGSGALLAEYPLTSGGPFGDFINDVIVTRDAAYFTNSFAAELYRVPLGPAGALPDAADVEAVALTGDWVQLPGFFVFNANGIAATPNGKDLIVVNSAAATLFQVDPQSGAAATIDLGGASVPFGDGLVLQGKTLYVVQNQLNQIGVITLSRDLSSGSVGTPITNPLYDVPTTADIFGNSLYAVNAKFGTPSAGTPYEIIKVSR